MNAEMEVGPAALVLTNPYEDAEIRFYAEVDDWVFKITSDGVIEFGDGIQPTDAAAAFIAAVKDMLPGVDLKVAR